MTSLVKHPLSRPLPGFLRGLIGREMLAVAPVLAGLLIMQALAPFLPHLWSAMSNNPSGGFQPKSLATSLWAFFLIAAFLVGVLCGAEEEENGTAVIARQLPVSSTRIFLEKISGALLVLAIWYLLALTVDLLILSASGLAIPPMFFDISYAQAPLMFFCFSLATGAWMRKVIPAALSGGILAFSWWMLIAQITESDDFLQSFMRTERGTPILLFGCTLTLSLAAWSFMFRNADGSRLGSRLRSAFGWEACKTNWRVAIRPMIVLGLPLLGFWLLLGTLGLNTFQRSLFLFVTSCVGMLLIPTSFSSDQIFWKERRSHWPYMTLSLAACIIASPFVGMLLSTEILDSAPHQKPVAGLIGLSVGLMLTIAILCASLWSSEEFEISRGCLYTLPLSLAKILRLKLRALFWHVGILVLLAGLMALLLGLSMDSRLSAHSGAFRAENYRLGSNLFDLGFHRTKPPLRLGDIGSIAALLLTAIPAFALFVVSLKLYFRSVIVTVFLSALYIPAVFIMLGDLSTQIVNDYGHHDLMLIFRNGAFFFWLLRQGILTLSLGAWLFWLYSRSSIHERGATARFFGALLFVVTFYEAFGFFLFADYREILFILFGL